MSWQNHIDKITKKASKRVAILSRIRHTLPRSALERVYISMIRPVLEDGNTIYDNCTLSQSEQLESVQRKAAIICSGAYRHTEHRTLISELGWVPLSTLRQNQKLTTYYKMTHNLCPKYMTDMLTNQNTNITRYRLRNRENRQTPKTRLNIYKNSFIPSSTKSWNELSVQTRNTVSLETFKKKLTTSIKHLNLSYYRKYKNKSGIWLARLRMGLSALNAHRFKYNFIDNPTCSHYHSGNETTKHYFFQCPAYAAQRLELLNSLDTRIGTNIFNTKEMMDTILLGNTFPKKCMH
jgi:hypothetical protein